MTFQAKLQHAWSQTRSFLCVGLDPDLEKFPLGVSRDPDGILAFNRAMIDATGPYVCAFKPQFAHHAAAEALDVLRDTIAYIREKFPQVVVVLDAKRCDIGNTAAFYAKEAFDIYNADAVTVAPYLGGDSLIPFTERPDRGTFVLCRTSNPGSAELQGLAVSPGERLYERVANLARTEWNRHNNVGLVVGATWPRDLEVIRKLAPDLPFLVPGVGAQGGDAVEVMRLGRSTNGLGLLINASRSVLYASRGEGYAEAAAKAAKGLRDELNAPVVE